MDRLVAYWSRHHVAKGVIAALLLIVVAVANTTTVADPRPALLAFFHGGW